MSVKQYDPPIKGTVFCHWCGFTNHAMPEIRYFRIDGVMGCSHCWSIVRRVTDDLGITEKMTLMKDIVCLMKKYKKRLEKVM